MQTLKPSKLRPLKPSELTNGKLVIVNIKENDYKYALIEEIMLYDEFKISIKVLNEGYITVTPSELKMFHDDRDFFYNDDKNKF